MKEKYYEVNSKYKLQNEELVLEESIMNKLHETDDGYRLDILMDDEEFAFDKVTGMISDEARYWFYRHTCTLKDLMELKFKMQPNEQN